MNKDINQIANKLAIQATINSLFALALEELLNIEDLLIERIAILRDQIEAEDAA